MVVSKIATFAAAKPQARAMVCNGQNVSYGHLARMIQAARSALIAASVSRSGIALLALNDIALTWPWLLACQSLGLTTIAASASFVESLGLEPLACVVGEGADTLNAAVRIDTDTARHHLIEAHDDLAGDIGAAGHVMLSSGTTGLPKMVHFGPESLLTTMTFPYVATTYDETTVTYVGGFPIATAVGYLSALRVWWSGGFVVIEQGSEPLAPFRTGDITEAFLTPGMLGDLLDIHPDERIINPHMNLAIVGALAPWPLVERAMVRLTPHVSALYGSTEVGRVARTPLRSVEDTFLYVIDEGRTVEIVDDHDRPCPDGVIGLVRIDTRAGVVDYWRDPETTRMFFRDGCFYTGDLGRLHADGRLELMGRANDVLIIRGDKKSAQIFEQRIRDAVSVTDVCIVQSPIGTGSDKLHVVYESAQPLPEAHIDRLRAQLPQDIEAVVYHREKLPRNAMGKITRLMLRTDISVTD